MTGFVQDDPQTSIEQPRASQEELRRDADEVVCAATPEPFLAIGLWYEHFPQTSDDEIRDLLGQAARARGGG